jgi:AcrR family transcriptional regulator
MSLTDIRYDAVMGRWEPDARGRLLQAAFELYVERGFEETTVAEIAAKARLTERTFFRHFTDKREVLFAGASDLQALLVNLVLNAPAALTPMATVRAAFIEAAAFFGEQPEFARQRQRIILSSTELQERELIKLATLASAMGGALRERGVKEPGASLAAEAGVTAFRIAIDRWANGPTQRELAGVMDDVFIQLRSITSET